MKKTPSPHDKYFKFNLSVKSNAVDFFTNYFPEEILNLTDFDTLEISKDSFVDEELKEYFSDIIYTVNIAGSDSYIYILFEHKSYNDSLPVLQTLKYIISIWELHLKRNEIKDKYKTKKLPIVLPVLLYHGKEKLSSGEQLTDSMEGPVKELAQFIPDFKTLVYDLSDYSDDELKGNAALRVVLLMLKHIFDDDFPSEFKKIMKIFKEVLESKTGLESFLPLIRYVFSTREDLSVKDIVETVSRHISKEKGGKIMTLAEKLREEGEKIGEARGEEVGEKRGEARGKKIGEVEKAREVLIILAQDKFDLSGGSVVKDIKSIETLEILDKLFLKTLSCESLEEFKYMINEALDADGIFQNDHS